MDDPLVDPDEVPVPDVSLELPDDGVVKAELPPAEAEPLLGVELAVEPDDELDVPELELPVVEPEDPSPLLAAVEPLLPVEDAPLLPAVVLPVVDPLLVPVEALSVGPALEEPLDVPLCNVDGEPAEPPDCWLSAPAVESVRDEPEDPVELVPLPVLVPVALEEPLLLPLPRVEVEREPLPLPLELDVDEPPELDGVESPVLSVPVPDDSELPELLGLPELSEPAWSTGGAHAALVGVVELVSQSPAVEFAPPSPSPRATRARWRRWRAACWSEIATRSRASMRSLATAAACV